MKKLLYTLVLLAIVGFVLFKGAVWVLTDTRLEAALETAVQDGVIHRGHLSSSLSGQMTLHDARYQRFQLTQPVQARILRYTAKSPIALIQTLMDPHQLPGEWLLEADGLRLELSPAMIKDWVAPDEDTMPSLAGLVCGPDHRQQLGSGDLIRMGVPELRGDALLRQTVSGVHFELNTANTGSVEITLPDARLSIPRSDTPFESIETPVSVVLRDGGLMRKVAAYCARETSMDIADWVALVTTGFREALNARGYEPSQQMLALYQRWLTEGGKLEFTMNLEDPTFGIPVQALEANADEAGAFAIKYNDAGVPDVYLTGMEPVALAIPEQALEPVVPEGPDAIMADWRETAIDDAGRWLERTVRVTLSSGRVVEGRLTRIGEDRLEVARMIDGGEVVYPMSIRAIERFDVWRRGSDQGSPISESAPERTPDAETTEAVEQKPAS